MVLCFLLVTAGNGFAQWPACNWAYSPVGVNTFNALVANTALDLQGNVIQIGKIYGIADMDPASGPQDTSFSFPGYNYYVSKTDISGHLIWIKYFRGIPNISSFDFYGLGVNSQNEIIIAGGFFGLVDFDLSANAVDTLRSHQPTYQDFFIAKYDASGNYLWAFNIGDVNNQAQIKTISLSSTDNILVAINTVGPVDIDPGIAVHNTLGGNANLICYDINGNYLWNNNSAVAFSYTENSKSLESDGAGDVYLLTVGYYELTVNKFNNQGVRIWNKTLGQFSAGARVNPQSLLMDTVNACFYVVGTYEGTVDFDPGIAVAAYTSTTTSYQEGFVAKYDSSMNLLWVKVYSGKMNFGKFGMDFSQNDIVLVGNIDGSVTLGSGITLSSTAISPFFLIVDTAGNSLTAFNLNGTGAFNTINVDLNQQFITSGYIASNTDMDPGPAVLNLSVSNTTSFTAVYASLSSGIEQSPSNINLSVFPNPSDGNVLIMRNSEFPATLEIYTATGERVQSLEFFSASKVIDLTTCAKGIYFVKVMDDRKSFGLSKIVIY